MTDRPFAVVDLADHGASALRGDLVTTPHVRPKGDPLDRSFQWWKRDQSLINHESLATVIYPAPADGTGRPLWTNLGLASPLQSRDHVLLAHLPGDPACPEEHDQLIGRAAGQIGRQLTRGNRPRVGIVAGDLPSISSADRIISEARSCHRAEATLIPWSIAASAYWRDRCPTPPAPRSQSQFPVACLLRRHDRIMAARTYLIPSPERHLLIPLRDYEEDPELAFDSTVSAERSLRSWVGKHKDWAGLIFSGGIDPALVERLACCVDPTTITLTEQFRDGVSILSLGAGSIMLDVVAGRVPYYATAPRVELQAFRDSCVLANLGRPRRRSVSFWFDCLRGASINVAGHRVFPANQETVSDYYGTDVMGTSPSIEVGPSLTFSVRLQAREVRRLQVAVDGAPAGTRLPCAYGCSYVVGSGRPKVFIWVPSLRRRFDLEWDRLGGAGETITTDLDHLQDDEAVREEFQNRRRYTDWWRHYHHDDGRPLARDPGPRPGDSPGFHEWRRRFTASHPNPCPCQWCRR